MSFFEKSVLDRVSYVAIATRTIYNALLKSLKTERLHVIKVLSKIGETNVNPASSIPHRLYFYLS